MNGRVYSCLAATWRMTLEALNNSSWFVELLKFTILFMLFLLTALKIADPGSRHI